MKSFYFIDENNIVFFLIGALLFSLVSLILAIIFFLQNKKNNEKLKILFQGKHGKDLEEIIMENNLRMENLDKEIQQLFDISNQINNLANKSLSRFTVLRFNPFKDLGGDQSFVATFLDSKDNGLVISSMHTKEGTRVYSKPIFNGQEGEKYKLTAEEKEAVRIASES